MNKILTAYKAPTDIPLRQVMFEDFQTDVPIKGGWGYSKEDAIVIDRNDPIISPGDPFDETAVEYFLVENRIYEELIVCRPKGEKFSGLKWELVTDERLNDNGKQYDHLVFQVYGHEEIKYFELQKEFEANKDNPSFDLDRNLKELQEIRYHYESEYWFDISSIY